MDNMGENSSEDFSCFVEIVKKGRIWYKCTLCPNKEFQTKAHRKYHWYWHDKNKPKPYNCATCGAGFIAKSHYNYHLGTHSGEKPYKCPTCKKGFLSRSKVNRHVRIHTGKVFKCQHCEKKFKTIIGRKQHERIHCFKKHGNLRPKRKPRKQAITPGEEKPYPCTTCDKEFKYAKDLRRHILVHTGERKFKCLICKVRHQRKDNLMRHIRKVHDQTEESAIEFVWEQEDAEEQSTTSGASSEENTDVEIEESSSEDGSSTSSESTDSETEVSAEDDDSDHAEMASAEVEERPEIFKAVPNEEEIAVVDAMTTTVADSMWHYELSPPEPIAIVEIDDLVKADETVAEVIFNKDALVITRVTAKVDDEKVETGVALNEIAFDVVSNEEIAEYADNEIGNITHYDGDGITFHVESVDAGVNDFGYTTSGNSVHTDHSYAHIEYSTETEAGNDINLEATVAVEFHANEGEALDDYNAVGQNVSSCKEEALLHGTAANEGEIELQLLFSLKEDPTREYDLKVNDTSANDIMYSTYLDRKRITREFLSFLCTEEDPDKENEFIGNIMTIDEFGNSREMEAGGILTFARGREAHVEPLLIQKILLYSSPTEPIYFTIEDTIIVKEQQRDDIVELHYWGNTDNNHVDNFNQELAFNEDNLMQEDAIADNDGNWNGAFSLEEETTMNPMESDCVVMGLVGPQDVQNTYEYQSDLDERIQEQNSPWIASESLGEYYGEQLSVHQVDLQLKYGDVDNQDYFEDFHINPEPSTGNVPASREERVENDMGNKADDKVKLIQIPKKRLTSWFMNQDN